MSSLGGRQQLYNRDSCADRKRNVLVQSFLSHTDIIREVTNYRLHNSMYCTFH